MNEFAVKALIVKSGKFLILEQEVDGDIHFTLPGGRVQNPDYKKELKREIKEEIGVEINVQDFIGEWKFTRKDQSITTCKVYRCTLMTDEFNFSNSEDYEKIINVRWITKNEFLEGNYTSNSSLKELVANLKI